MQQDAIDDLIGQWRRERPDLDPAPMGVVGRVLRLARGLERRLEGVLRPFDLNLCQFDLLATLRRSGDPFTLNPTQLGEAAMLTSGAMTNRIDRLESKGLVERIPDPTDRRGTLIRMTPSGRELVDRAVAARFDEARLDLAPLEAGEIRALEDSLRRLVRAADLRPA